MIQQSTKTSTFYQTHIFKEHFLIIHTDTTKLNDGLLRRIVRIIVGIFISSTTGLIAESVDCRRLGHVMLKRASVYLYPLYARQWSSVMSLRHRDSGFKTQLLFNGY